MQSDYLGNPLTEQRDGTLRGIDDFIEGYLGYETRAERILKVADADPGSCMANVYAGLLWMLLEAPQAPARAAPYIAAAERAALRATQREQLNTAMLGAWAGGDLRRTIQLCDQISDEFPRDLVIVKTHQYFEFNRGNCAGMLRAVLKVGAENGDVPQVYGMKAFGYEQCHLLDEAESEARAALAMRRKEPWAQHALAHVFLTRGQIEAGAQFLEDASDTWSGLNSFMLTHLGWHLALFYLSQGREREALKLYDEHCWGIAKDYSQDQAGAISLLARFEIAGIEVGSRWDEVAGHVAVRAHDTVQPFLTLHYLYGLARARRPEAETLLQTVRDYARRAPEFIRGAWLEVALPACEGVYAYARGDYEQAWQRLCAAVPRMTEIGGSHAQRDLFGQFLLDAALRSARWSAAQQLLELRRAADPNGVPVNRSLARVYGKLGLAGLAEQARSRAALSRARHAVRAP